MESNQNLTNEYTTDNFIKAVHILFYGKDSDMKKQADVFICEFERKSEAWDIAMQILNTPSLEEEVYYNASQIIKKKIRFDFGNYKQVEIFQNLANFLTDKMNQFKDHKLYLLTNFCKCFALLTVFAHQKYSEIIKILCGRLYNKDIKNLMSLLLVFNYLAENESDADIVIDKSERESFSKFLVDMSDDVIAFIDYLIKILSDENYKKQMIQQDSNMLNFFRIMNRNVKLIY